jgi:hypothetical protein
MKQNYLHNTIVHEQGRWITCLKIGTGISLVYHETEEAAQSYLARCLERIKERSVVTE